jgi:hypothetical protein
VLLFCVATGTDWAKAGITGATAQVMMVKNLIDRDRSSMHFVLTKLGRAVLAELLERAGIKISTTNDGGT